MIDITKAIESALKEDVESLMDDFEQESEEVAKETVDYLKTNSPKKYRNYAPSWSYKKTGKNRIVVYNKKHYQRTHLLEKGHAKVGGGRVGGTPHIGPARDQAERQIVERLKARRG